MMEDDSYAPDWQQQHEVERHRYETTLAALERCAKAGAKPEDLIVLARECGITNYRPPNADRRTASVG
jgi:hypothetical protein